MEEESSIEEIAERVRMLERDEVAELGAIPIGIYGYSPNVSRSSVVLTGERKLHLLDGHPEMQGLVSALVRTIRNPDEVYRNKRDALVAIFWRRVEGQESYLRVAVLFSEGAPLQHSVMSAWRVRRKDFEREGRQGRLMWKRGEGS